MRALSQPLEIHQKDGLEELYKRRPDGGDLSFPVGCELLEFQKAAGSL